MSIALVLLRNTTNAHNKIAIMLLTAINIKTGTIRQTTVSKGHSGHTLENAKYVVFRGTLLSAAINFTSTSRQHSRLSFLRLNRERIFSYTTAHQPWVLDSGATHHITSDLNNLSLHQPYTGGEEVLIGDGSGLQITHTGSVSLPTNLKPLSLKNILLVPNIHKNLLSVYKLCNNNKVFVEFFPSHFQVKDLNSGARLLQGRTNKELYEWPAVQSPPSSFYATPTTKTTLNDWHSRLGHPSISTLKTILSKFSLPISASVSNNFSCLDCLSDKSQKLSFAQTSISSTRPLEYLFTDLWTSPVTSIDNYKHYLIIVDHFTRYSWFYPLQLKSHVKETFIKFKYLTENKFQTKIGTLFSDNGENL